MDRRAGLMAQPPEGASAARSGQLRWAIAGVIAFAVIGVLAVPWFVPVKVLPIYSDSQAAGFSNRSAQIALVLAALAMALLAWRTARERAPFVSTAAGEPRDRLRAPLVAVMATLVGAFQIGLGYIVRAYPTGDVLYFADRLLYIVSGYVPYRDFVFAYGPLLIYPQYALYLLLGAGASPWRAVYLWSAIMGVVGVVLLAFVLNRLSLTRGQRRVLFVAAASIAFFQPNLGLNYTPLRFITPYALLVAVFALAEKRSAVPKIALAALGAATLAFAISPEIGIALVAGLVAALGWRGLHGDRRSLAIAASLAVLAVLLAFVAVRMPFFQAAGGGATQSPALPGVVTLLYIGAILATAWGAGAAARDREPGAGSLPLGWMTIGAVLIVAALGRADWQHILWNGLGVMLAGVAVLSKRRPKVACAWMWATVVGVLLTLVAFNIGSVTWWELVVSGVKAGSIGKRDAAAVSKLVTGKTAYGRGAWETLREQEPSASDLAYLKDLRRVTSFKHLTGPMGRVLAENHALTTDNGNLAFVLTGRQLSAARLQIEAADYVLMSRDDYRLFFGRPDRGDVVMWQPRRVGYPLWNGIVLGVPVTLPARHPILDEPASLGPLLARDFVIGRTMGDWVLLRRKTLAR